jgi:hypothetical protein
MQLTGHDKIKSYVSDLLRGLCKDSINISKKSNRIFVTRISRIKLLFVT